MKIRFLLMKVKKPPYLASRHAIIPFSHAVVSQRYFVFIVQTYHSPLLMKAHMLTVKNLNKTYQLSARDVDDYRMRVEKNMVATNKNASAVAKLQ